MRVAGLAIALFGVAFALHWIVWHIRMPRRQTAALLAILLGVLPLGLAAVAFLPGLRALGLAGPWEYLHVAIFHVAMSLAYVVAYSALEGRSPSMSLLVHVADSGSQGCSREELEAMLKSAQPVESRLQAMVRDHMLNEADGAYSLTPKGRVWGQVFSMWLRLLKMDKGG
jgi:hypothetical protein